ncbi:MAG: hypothetical protein A2284_00920 [Deltaproteobacteria bacterium RIFOXYA12_FULL_61_11]|nr:MAG: hypothetical protein A2284_00920 [Deltaproteobacteria bacterium RIFOXYA12_FULL_61_11]
MLLEYQSYEGLPFDVSRIETKTLEQAGSTPEDREVEAEFEEPDSQKLAQTLAFVVPEVREFRGGGSQRGSPVWTNAVSRRFLPPRPRARSSIIA